MAATDKLNSSEVFHPSDISYGIRMAYQGMKAWRVSDVVTALGYTAVGVYTVAMIANIATVY
jgi:hypothetical protein